MNYISSKDLSEQWGISQRRIVRLAREGRIEGAKLYGRSWIFPEDAQKPADGRTSYVKSEKQSAESFRFPSFEFRDVASFIPPLSKEELILKEVTERFYACHVEKADKLLGDLPETAVSRYIRIAALYTGCMVDIFLCNTERFIERYAKLSLELEEDFPHKVEMEEFLHTLNASLGDNIYYSQQFRVIPGYRYHESFLPRLANLCAVPFSYADSNVSVADLKSHELNCIVLEQSGALADLQSIHLSLGVAYGMMDMRDETDYHLGKALELAERYNMLYPVAAQYYYTRNLFRGALKNYSEQFKKKLLRLSDEMKSHYLPFTEEISAISTFKLLTRHDYIYLYYALLGLTNSDISKRMHISVGTVGNRYSSIYAALGVNGKSELIALYRNTIGGKT